MDPPTYPFEETSFMNGPYVVILNKIQGHTMYSHGHGQGQGYFLPS